MLPTAAYFACLLVIAPAATLALASWGMSQVTDSKSWGRYGRMLMQLREAIDSAPKLIVIVVILVAIVMAGCFRSTRPAGCLVLGLLGIISVVRVLSLDRSSHAWLLMMPSAVGVVVSFWWAWSMMSTDLASSASVVRDL
jgi:hypothetical protein